jgi:hypothetical protein
MRLFSLLYFIFSTVLLSASPYDMIPPEDPALEDLKYLSLETKRSILSFTPPLAPDEIEQFLEKIDCSSLSPAALEAYDRVQKRLYSQNSLAISGNFFSMSFHANLTIEGRLRFNQDIEWYSPKSGIAPLLSLPIQFHFTDLLQLYFEPIIAMDTEHYDSAEYLNINIPLKANQFDLNLPLRAFVAAGSEWWSFQLGRDRLSYGMGHLGNLVVSDNPDFYEFTRLSFFSHFFKYSFLIIQSPLDITDDIYSGPALQPGTLNKTTQRNFYLHRLDFNFFDVLSFALMEGLMVGNSAIEIRYLNPLIIFHSLYSSWDYDTWTNNGGDMNGSIFSVELNWNIINSLATYGQFVMNEFATPYEIEGWPDSQPPNGLGYLGGIKYSHSFNIWRSLFFFEFIYTDPYLYMNSTPFSSFIWMRRLSLDPSRLRYDYFGYSRDTIAYTLGTEFSKSNTLKISGEFSYLCQGEHTIVWDWQKGRPANQEKTPSGTAEHKLIASAGMQLKPSPHLVLSGNITGIFSLNNYHVKGTNQFGGQAILAANFIL